MHSYSPKHYGFIILLICFEYNNLEFQTVTSYNLEFQNIIRKINHIKQGKECFMDGEERIDILKLIKTPKIELKDKQVDILIALSNNEGYAKTELAEKIGSWDSYASKLLDELSLEVFGNLNDSMSIEGFHLKDPLSLAHRIQDQGDPVSKYIYKNWSSAIIDTLASQNRYLTALFLAYGFSYILLDENFYNEERFSKIKLSEDAIKLIASKEDLKQGNIRFLNRILIEDAYPDEICKTRITLIYQSLRFGPGKSRRPYFINPDLRTFILIGEHIKNQILLDRNRLDLMKTKLKIKLAPYRGIEKFCEEDPPILEEIKEGHMDMNYYKKRYNDNIYALQRFMTSNYVEELKEKYDYIDLELRLNELSENEFNLAKFRGIDVPEVLSKMERLERLNDDYDILLNKK
jgi:hypothetical protein